MITTENQGIKSAGELKASVVATPRTKLLVRKSEKLNIQVPGPRNLQQWIDWLPYLQSLAEEGRLKEARQLDPYIETYSRFSNVDKRMR